MDPVTADANTGANFNRYKYAANNPYRFLDPDGRREKEFEEIEKKDSRSLEAHSSNRGSNGLTNSAKSFTSGNAQKRYSSAVKAVGSIKETVEAKRHDSPDAASRTFHDSFQPISTRYGVEINSNIEENVGVFQLSDTSVGYRFRPDGIGYTVNLPSDGNRTIHSHPFPSVGVRG